MIGQAVAWVAKNHWRFSPMNLYEKFEKHRFDRRHGVDTHRDVALSDVRIDSPNKHLGKRYHATPPVSFRRILHRLRIDFADYTFIDMGSGKGRTLLLASDLPFNRIIGVEFGEELHRHAQRNIQLYKARHGARSQSLHMDATQFVFPDGPLVIYLFNPFHGAVLRQVLANIVHAASTSSRKIFIVYLYLEDQEMIDEFKEFVTLFRWHRFDVMECRPACAAQPSLRLPD